MRDKMSADTAYRVTPQCLEALREAVENYLTELFEETQLAAVHARRITITCALCSCLASTRWQ